MDAFEIVAYGQMAVGLLVPLAAAICGFFCIVYRRLSPWLTLTALGFLGESLVGFTNRVFWLVIVRNSDGMPSHKIMGVVSFGTLIGSVVAALLILNGFVLALGDIQRRMTRLREASGEMRDRLPVQEAQEAWQPRKEGSRDIQE